MLGMSLVILAADRTQLVATLRELADVLGRDWFSEAALLLGSDPAEGYISSMNADLNSGSVDFDTWALPNGSTVWDVYDKLKSFCQKD